MESLAPVLVDEMELLVDLMPADTHVLVLDPERARTRAHDLVATSEEFLGASWAAAAGGGRRPDRPRRRVATARSATSAPHALGQGKAWWTISPFGIAATVDDAPLRDARRVGRRRRRPWARRAGLPATRRAYRGDIEQAVGRHPASGSSDGCRVVVVHPGHGPAQRMVEVLAEHDVAARLVEDVRRPRQPPDGRRHGHAGCLDHGFVDDDPGLVVLTGEDLSGQKASTRDMRKMPARRKRQIDPLELKAGDYVVHEQHGVGRFVEMKQREVQGAVREYLVLEYGASKRGGPPDRLYVPADALDQVTRYVGGEQPSLDRLGGADWAKRKGRARKAVREIAAELIKLYAARQATKGHAFGPDTPVAARARGRVPVPRDPRPAEHGRRGQGRHEARRCRWTGWCAATSATARPRSRCGRRSRRCRTASRSPCWCRPRCWSPSTSRRSPSG